MTKSPNQYPDEQNVVDPEGKDNFDKYVIIALIGITLSALSGAFYVYSDKKSDQNVIIVEKETGGAFAPEDLGSIQENIYENKNYKIKKIPHVLIMFKGKCSYAIDNNTHLSDCNDKALYTLYKEGGYSLLLSSAGLSYVLGGNSDRQPTLENYYTNIKTINILKGNELIETRNNLNGECHMKMNKQATRFYFIHCEIYDPEKRQTLKYFLNDIYANKKKIFKDATDIGEGL